MPALTYFEKCKELTKEMTKKRKEYMEAKINLRKLEKLYSYIKLRLF